MSSAKILAEHQVDKLLSKFFIFPSLNVTQTTRQQQVSQWIFHDQFQDAGQSFSLNKKIAMKCKFFSL